MFLSPSDDTSLIIEVLQLVKDDGAGDSLDAAVRSVSSTLRGQAESSTGEETADLLLVLLPSLRFHFSSLAHDNTALSSSVTSISLPTPPAGTPSSTDPAVLGPTVLVGTQLVSKFNKSEAEADTVLIQFALWRIPGKDADVTLCVNCPVRMGETGEEKSDAEARRVFEEAVKSFKIVDFGLFAGGE